MDYGDGEVQSYTFDPLGNRLTKVVNGVAAGYSDNNANWLLTRAGQSDRNDANDNTLRDGQEIIRELTNGVVAASFLVVRGAVCSRRPERPGTARVGEYHAPSG